MSVDPTNRFLATGSNDNHIRIWSLQPNDERLNNEWIGLGENLTVLQGSGGANAAINCLRFSPSPKNPYLVACTQDGLIYVHSSLDWNLQVTHTHTHTCTFALSLCFASID
jgi:WD40 repeat protein